MKYTKIVQLRGKTVFQTNSARRVARYRIRHGLPLSDERARLLSKRERAKVAGGAVNHLSRFSVKSQVGDLAYAQMRYYGRKNFMASKTALEKFKLRLAPTIKLYRERLEEDPSLDSKENMAAMLLELLDCSTTLVQAVAIAKQIQQVFGHVMSTTVLDDRSTDPEKEVADVVKRLEAANMSIRKVSNSDE